MQLSVIICAHNPRADYLSRTMAALQVQSFPTTEWELILLDNASAEPLAGAWDLSWHPRGRHIREDQLGLTSARVRAVREALGDLLVFVDDDNVLASDYLERVVSLAEAHPHLGVFGSGRLEPEYELPPTAEVLPFLPLLALREVARPHWSNNSNDMWSVPYGAGLCATRSVAARWVQLVHRLNLSRVLGRRGKELFCGEDDLFSWAAVTVDQGFGVFPGLRITHLIPAARIEPSYVLRLVHGHAFSHAILSYLLFGEESKSLGPFEIVRDIVHGLRRGPFSTRCRWAGVRGAKAALRFVKENQVKPLEEGRMLSFGFASASDLGPFR